MSLAGTGAIIIWNDVRDDARDAVYEWHNREHIPERVGIPGFRRGRRFAALAGSPEFLILYEAKDIAAAEGPAYFERLNNPTPWTVRTNKNFLNTIRGICEVPFSAGYAEGGCALTLRLDPPPGQETPLHRFLVEEALPAALRDVGVVAAHLLVARRDTSLIETVERTGRAPLRAPNRVVLLEGMSAEILATACDRHLPAERLSALCGGAPAERGIYALQVARSAGHRD